jgi:2-polyprenyl-3-methyl-5-hydroxy-6-metoxy-1,4-benzoquinol methylase/Zn ribbon nucleic-acid-binding protein
MNGMGTDSIAHAREAPGGSLDLAQMRPAGFLQRMRQSELQLIDKVSNGAGWIDNPACLVCRGTQREPVWRAHGIMLLRCLVCGHHYFERMPRDLTEVYEGPAYLEQSKGSYLANLDYRLRRFARERLDILGAHKPFGRGQSLLDVGCGTGWFLRAAKERGYEINGFEFSAALARFTAETVGCTVHHSHLTAIGASFDIATLFDVIEHVPDPVDTLRAVRAALKPGGLVLVFCPNFDSLAIRASGAESNLVMPTRHLSYFTRSSVQRLCALTGMKLLWYRTAGIDIGDLMAWYESRGMPRDLPLWQSISDTLQPAIDALQAGNHLRFMAAAADG